MSPKLFFKSYFNLYIWQVIYIFKFIVYVYIIYDIISYIYIYTYIWKNVIYFKKNWSKFDLGFDLLFFLFFWILVCHLGCQNEDLFHINKWNVEINRKTKEYGLVKWKEINNKTILTQCIAKRKRHLVKSFSMMKVTAAPCCSKPIQTHLRLIVEPGNGCQTKVKCVRIVI